MAVQLHDTGEEYYQDKLNGETFTVGLYNDTTDALTDAEDYGAITTEPAGAAYNPQSSTFSSTKTGGDWTLTNDAQLSFDVSDSNNTVDSYFILVNFISDDKGETTTGSDHLLATGSLSQSRDLSQIDTYNIPAGDCGTSLS